MISALTLDQLRVLVAIEETGSFSAAGRKLQRVQSAISSSVQAIETSQRLTLFDRSGRTPQLTEAGKVLVMQARQVLRQAELFERTANAIAAGLEPELTIAMDCMVPSFPVLECLSRLQSVFPDLTVTLFTERVWTADRRVHEGSAALGLCGLLPTAEQQLQARALMHIDTIAVAAPDHPLALQRGELTREQLSDFVQLVLTDPFAQGGPNYSVVSARTWRFVDMHRRLEFLLAGFGWCTMPTHLIEDHLQAGALVQLNIKDPAILAKSIPLYLVHHRDRPLGTAGRWLVDALVKEFAGLN